VDGLGSLLAGLEQRLATPTTAASLADRGERFRPQKAAVFSGPDSSLPSSSQPPPLSAPPATSALAVHTSSAAATTARVRQALRTVGEAEGAPVVLQAGGGGRKAAAALTVALRPPAAASATAALFADSINTDALAHARDAAFQARAAKAQRLEEMDAAMLQVTSRTVSRWHCASCERWWDKPPTMCYTEGHRISESKATQHALQCGHCTRRLFTFALPCFTPCANCGRVEWQTTSIFQLRGGAAMSDDVTLDPSRKLRPTGDLVENSLRFGGELHAGEG